METTTKHSLTGSSPAMPDLLVTKRTRRREHAIAVAILLALVLAMFADVLFTSRSILLSREGTDLSMHFARWRQFGFGELSRGNLALWNPHLFSGAPYVGGFQSALFYPPNLLHLLLPNHMAINWLIAIHVFLCGLFMYLWARSKGLSWPAGLLAGSLYMFAGSNYLHTFAGHLPIIYSASWIPLLFWSLDRYLQSSSLGSGLVTILCVTMEILTGHPQTVFYTVIAAGLYTALHFIRAPRKIALLAGWGVMVLATIGLTAVQVWPGLNAVAENVRSQGGYDYAAMFSLPPENFLTLLVPGFFGDSVSFPYWGRCHLWEMCLFVSITGLVLAVYGALRGPKDQRRFLAPVTIILLVLALGSHTPLFKLLYTLPGFNTFRGNSKFSMEACLLISMLAGVGMDQLRRMLTRARATSFPLFPLMIACGAMIAAVAGIVLYGAGLDSPAPWWQSLVQKVPPTNETYLNAGLYYNPEFITLASQYGAKGLFIAAGTLILLAGLIYLASLKPRFAYLPVGLAIVEIFIFARYFRPTFDPMDRPQSFAMIDKFLEDHPGDYRILNQLDINGAMLANAKDIWGYDPSVSLRYAEFMTHTQGGDIKEVSQYVTFKGVNPLYRMLRLKYCFIPSLERPDDVGVEEMLQPLPPLVLITDYAVATQRDDIFSMMDQPSFDPSRKVIMEKQPDPAPVPSEDSGSATIIDSGTDHLTIQAELTQPAILLVTDGYSKDWRVAPLPGSSQQHYELMPANYILRAVPLAAGHHLFRMEYAPIGYTVGRWISLASLIGYLFMVAWWAKRTLMPPRPIAPK